MGPMDILNHFGLKKQTKKFMEEAGELHEALIEYRIFKNSLVEGQVSDEDLNKLDKLRAHVISEIADNTILLDQFLSEVECTGEELDYERSYKFRRTIDKYGIDRED